VVSHHDEIFRLIPRSLLRGGFINLIVTPESVIDETESVDFLKRIIAL